MKTNDILRRSIHIPATVRVREAGEDEQPSRIIEGYALKFGVRSRLLSDWWDPYYEILEPGSVMPDMLSRQDIKLTMFHDRRQILARSKNGSGTLNWEVDETGVKFWAEMPNTAEGDKALELVGRGDIDGCSFMYSTDEDDEKCVSYESIEEDGREVMLRHVWRIDHVYDYTLTPDPAYEQTECARRDMEHATKPAQEEKPAPRVDEARKRETLAKFRKDMKSRLV